MKLILICVLGVWLLQFAIAKVIISKIGSIIKIVTKCFSSPPIFLELSWFSQSNLDEPNTQDQSFSKYYHFYCKLVALMYKTSHKIWPILKKWYYIVCIQYFYRQACNQSFGSQPRSWVFSLEIIFHNDCVIFHVISKTNINRCCMQNIVNFILPLFPFIKI